MRSKLTITPAIRLRGDGPKTLHMEELQKSYIQAIAAGAGCTVGELRLDANKVDLTVEHRSSSHSVDSVVLVRLQLKSTHTISHSDHDSAPGAAFSYSLDNETLRVLSQPVFTVQRLLVVMIVPKEPQDWVVTDDHSLILHNRCYWVNLVGVSTSGVSSTTVHIPWANVLDAQSLCDIMGKIGQGVAP